MGDDTIGDMLQYYDRYGYLSTVSLSFSGIR